MENEQKVVSVTKKILGIPVGQVCPGTDHNPFQGLPCLCSRSGGCTGSCRRLDAQRYREIENELDVLQHK